MASPTAGTSSERFAGLILKEIKETGEEFGVGAYGRVFAVDYYGTVCAAKEVHSIIDTITFRGIGNGSISRDSYLRNLYTCGKAL